MTTMAPPRSVYHSSKRVQFGGGVYSDTRAGTRTAKAEGDEWIDKNGHVMPTTVADKSKPIGEADLTWVNAHGAPYTPDWVGGKWEERAYNPSKKAHPTIQSGLETFQQCARLGVKVEWEVKDLRPFKTRAILRRMMQKLAKSAQRAFGKNWADHVTVKCLTNLAGGIAYCFKVLRAAHEVGFKTMVLARGEWVHKVINRPFITWNRGGRVA